MFILGEVVVMNRMLLAHAAIVFKSTECFGLAEDFFENPAFSKGQIISSTGVKVMANHLRVNMFIKRV